jgi:hypothetical protein
MNKRLKGVIVVLLGFIIFLGMFTGCIEEKQKPKEIEELLEIKKDLPSILPDWEDGKYHDYFATAQMLNDFNEMYPNLTNIFSIGDSVLRKNIYCIRITDEDIDTEKYCVLLDGCIHGNEWESCEALLYLAEYLLINFDTNFSIKEMLNKTEIYIVPILNPDGRQADTRWNENGVDLNRNFDIFFGKLRGHCFRLGKLFGRIKIPFIKIPFIDPYYGWFSNCGRYPFSEPETQALKDLMKALGKKDFSLYMNCHTPTHNILTPWVSYKPPFKLSTHEKKIFNFALDWVETKTEYETYRGGPVQKGGIAMDWCFQEFKIPSFTFEIYDMKYVKYYGNIIKNYKHEHRDLLHWMKASLPVFLYMLVNIENFNNWEIPDILPSLPEGIPPDPLT